VTGAARSGGFGLSQVATSGRGGWDLDEDASWLAPLTPSHAYLAEIWVRSSAAATIVLSADLLDGKHRSQRTVSAAGVKLAANVWTRLSLPLAPKSGQVYAALAASFSGAARGTVLSYDDMGVTAS
jgi:hypothetical protein